MITDDASALAAQVRAAVCTETEAWRRLQRARARERPSDRTSALEQWMEANRRMREATDRQTAWSLCTAKESLRLCAEILSCGVRTEQESAPGIALIPPAARRFPPTPVSGQGLRDRSDTRWHVVAVTRDEMEPDLFLAHVQQDGAPEPIDVYSEDWTLFCVVHGLRAAAV